LCSAFARASRSIRSLDASGFDAAGRLDGGDPGGVGVGVRDRGDRLDGGLPGGDGRAGLRLVGLDGRHRDLARAGVELVGELDGGDGLPERRERAPGVAGEDVAAAEPGLAGALVHVGGVDDLGLAGLGHLGCPFHGLKLPGQPTTR
jgi:hypothetical protein